MWIQYFHSYLNENGRAGFVMASSATFKIAMPLAGMLAEDQISRATAEKSKPICLDAFSQGDCTAHSPS
jgi:hypothetical protein